MVQLTQFAQRIMISTILLMVLLSTLLFQSHRTNNHRANDSIARNSPVQPTKNAVASQASLRGTVQSRSKSAKQPMQREKTIWNYPDFVFPKVEITLGKETFSDVVWRLFTFNAQPQPQQYDVYFTSGYAHKVKTDREVSTELTLVTTNAILQHFEAIQTQDVSINSNKWQTPNIFFSGSISKPERKANGVYSTSTAQGLWCVAPLKLDDRIMSVPAIHSGVAGAIMDGGISMDVTNGYITAFTLDPSVHATKYDVDKDPNFRQIIPYDLYRRMAESGKIWGRDNGLDKEQFKAWGFEMNTPDAWFFPNATQEKMKNELQIAAVYKVHWTGKRTHIHTPVLIIFLLGIVIVCLSIRVAVEIRYGEVPVPQGNYGAVATSNP